MQHTLCAELSGLHTAHLPTSMPDVLGSPKDLFVFSKLNQALNRLYKRAASTIPVRYNDTDPEAHGQYLDLHAIAVRLPLN